MDNFEVNTALSLALSQRFIVGLTGGVGSGKSAAADEFARLGATVVDTDVIAHQLTGADGAAMLALEQAFGTACRRSDGSLDRAFMRERVFNDSHARDMLEKILHPMIFIESLNQAAQATGNYVILAIPLLFEHGHYLPWIQRVAVVDCPESLQIERVKARSGLSEAQVVSIMAAQVSRHERLARADDIIDNSQSLEALKLQVRHKHSYYSALAANLSGLSN